MISREADYAIRALLRLGLQGEGAVMSTATLASEMKIPFRFLRRIMRKLLSEGLVTSTRGKQGGVRLMSPTQQVSLFDIVQAMNPGSVQVNGCLNDPTFCDRSAACVVHKELHCIQQALQQGLRDVTLAKLVTQEQERVHALAE